MKKERYCTYCTDPEQDHRKGDGALGTACRVCACPEFTLREHTIGFEECWCNPKREPVRHPDETREEWLRRRRRYEPTMPTE